MHPDPSQRLTATNGAFPAAARLDHHDDVMAAIGALAQCATEAEAGALTAAIVRHLGAQSYVYTTVLPPNAHEPCETFRYFIGCKPEWCELYRKKKWMMNDPYVAYARTNSAPVAGSCIKAATPGQAAMLASSAEHGFRSGLVVPTHTSLGAKRRMGLLYIGADLAPDIGEPLLLKKRGQFVALGFELLCWWNARLRQEAMRKFSLLDDEIKMLQLAKDDRIASEIAAVLDLKVAAVYRKLERIKEKFNVDKISQAVVEADAAGLLG